MSEETINIFEESKKYVTIEDVWDSPFGYPESFINYPCKYLEEFGENVKDCEFTKDDILRLIGLYEIDTKALEFTKLNGVHPITGSKLKFRDDVRGLTIIDIDRMIIRNNMNIRMLKTFLTKFKKP